MSSRPWLEHYDPGVPSALEYPPVPIFQFLDEGAQRCPERDCLIFKDRSYSYAEVSTQTDRMAASLVSLGIRKGDRVGIFMTNSPEFVLAYFGILKAGAVVVATNPLYTPPEIIHQINDAGLQTVFCEGALYTRLNAARTKTSIRRVIVTGITEPETGDLRFEDLLLEHPESHSKEKARKEDQGESGNAVGPEDIALFQYTGGTTGVAKAAVATHRNLVANSLQFKAWMSTLKEEEETFLLALPVYHIYGMVCGMLLGMALRARMVILPDPRDIQGLISAIQIHAVTYFPAAPTLYNAINNSVEASAIKVDLSSIKACISGSAPLMKQTKERFEALTGGRIVEGYGLSEAPTATHCNPLLGENRFGSIGLPLPDVDARIVSLEDGIKEKKPGDAGELIIRSPQVMQGYYNMPDETSNVLKDGWLYTGDIARMDKDGYFYIIDRKKELIKPGGMEVWPREVEEVISSHPAVAEAAVAGIPDEYRGETVKAWVVLKPGHDLTRQEIDSWCRLHLAPFKVPTEVEFRDKLPKSSVGKVLKRELVGEKTNTNKTR